MTVKISSSIKENSKISQILDQFKEVDIHYSKFYNNIYGIIIDSVNFSHRMSELSKNKGFQRSLRKALKIIDNGDSILTKKGKVPIHTQKCKDQIKLVIEER